MKKFMILALLLLSLLCTACNAEPEDLPAEPEDPPQETGSEEAADPSEDYVLLTQVAQMDDGRLLTLDAYGKKLDEYNYGVKEVKVYDSGELIQTITAYDAVEQFWGSAADDLMGEYTSCPDVEKVLEVLDLNFDGNSDFGLFGWVPNNTIPYYYWQWDKDAGQYRYLALMQGVTAKKETGEVVSEYKSGNAGSEYVYDHYQPDEDGNLKLVEHEVSIYTEVAENQDTQRPVWETWVPDEGVTIRPVVWYQDDLVLIRREIPICETGEDHTAAYYTEIWELEDGELQLTSREEFSYET